MPDRPESPARSKAADPSGSADRSDFTRAIRVPHAVAMVVGTIIGASIFVQPSEVTSRVPTVGGIYAVWIVSGVLTLFGALVCAEWASRYPASGGVYVYLREAFSPAVGFLWGWAMFWTVHSGIIAVVAVVVARYTAYIVQIGDLATKAVAVGAILLLSAVNYAGVRQGSRLQTIFTAGKDRLENMRVTGTHHQDRSRFPGTAEHRDSYRTAAAGDSRAPGGRWPRALQIIAQSRQAAGGPFSPAGTNRCAHVLEPINYEQQNAYRRCAPRRDASRGGAGQQTRGI